MNERSTPRATVLHLIRSDFGTDVAVISRLDAGNECMVHIALTHHSDEVERFSTPFDFGACCETVLDTQAPLAVSSLDQSPDGIVCPFMEAEGYQSYLGVPIIVDGIASGVLQIMAFEAHDWSGPEKEKLAEYARILQTMFDPHPASVAAEQKVLRLN